jgi:RNA polymerase sigma factor (sigma-70 family)
MAIREQPLRNQILSLFDPEDPRRAEEEYLRFFRKLVWFFDRDNCESPEDLAADTMCRIVEAVGVGKEIRPGSYAYFWTVAKNVRMEARKRHKTEPLENDAQIPERRPPDLDTLIYIRECMRGALSDEEEALLRSCYEDGYQATAERLDTTIENVRLRVHRIRNKIKDFAAAAAAKREQNA